MMRHVSRENGCHIIAYALERTVKSLLRTEFVMPSSAASPRSVHPFGHLLVGRILVDRGIARLDQVTSCLQQQHAETRASCARRALGEIVVERGYARHDQIVEVLSYQRQQFATLMVGPYRLVATLGEGSSSVVYRAQPASGAPSGAQQQDVAIKILPQQRPGDVAALARFQREVQVGLSLDHPHILRTLDFGTTRDTYYIVTELMPGGSLAARIENHGPLDEAMALTMLEELLDALSYAWSRKLLHRDIKPSNILFDTRGVPKLADLGLASLIGDTLSPTSKVVGTPHYMAPEQALSAPDIDIRADLYSLGATLFYALSGGPPFPETTPVEAINQHLNATPPAIDRINPQVSARLAALVRKLMAKRPDDRYATPGEAENDVRRAQADQPTQAEQLTAARAYAPLGVQVRHQRSPEHEGAVGTRPDAKGSGGKPGTTRTHARKRVDGQGTATTTGVQLTPVAPGRPPIAPGTDRHQRARLAGLAEAKASARAAPRRRSGLLFLALGLLAMVAGGTVTCAMLMLQKRPPPAVAAPRAAAVLGAGPAVDLLERVEARSINPDQWSKRDHVLLSERGAWRFLAIPVQLPAEYDVSCTFKRLYPGGTVGLVFAIAGTALSCQMGGTDGRIGFDRVDGRAWDGTGSVVGFPDGMLSDKRYTVLIQVRHDALAIIIGGKAVNRLALTGHALSLEAPWSAFADSGLGVGVSQSQVAIYSLTMTPYAPKAEPTSAKP